MSTILCFLLHLFSVSLLAAAEPAERFPAAVYTLVIAPFFDTLVNKHPEFVFITNGIAYRSLDALKARIAQLPAGSTLTWASSDIRGGWEQPLSAAAELLAFTAHCEKHGIRFIVTPAG